MSAVTIHNLDRVSAQQVFDHIVTHLFTQRKQSYDPMQGICVYRHDVYGEEVTRCAAGCLIPKRSYRKEFEGKMWYDLRNWYDLSEAHVDLISTMQSVHDGSHVTELFAPAQDHEAFLKRTGYLMWYWYKACGLVAKKYKLSPDILKQYKARKPKYVAK